MADKILILNSGSTSLKFKLFDLENLELILENNYQQVENRAETIKNIFREIGNLNELKAIGHRVVHGGFEFSEPVMIDEDIYKKISQYNSLAPLHNPVNLEGVRICMEYFPQVANWAVFDTSFYKDLPEESRHYPIPLEITHDQNLYRFGFHGISHKYVADKACLDLKKDIKKTKIISCHLGGGSSITAIKNGQSVETSMGFTPMEGLMMMTRCGDIDPGIILKLAKTYGISETEDILNQKSGIYGVSGIKNYLEFLRQKNFGNIEASLAFKMFIHQIKKYIGAYYAILDGCDILIFTGMIGAGRPETRDAILDDMSLLKKTKVLALQTNEEYQIASEIKQKLAE